MTAHADLGSTRIRVAPQVIDPTELSSRIAATLQSIDTGVLDLTSRPGLPHKPYIEAGRRAEALHSLWATVAAPTIPAARGPRGVVGRLMKRAIRRLTSWYVEPRFAAQREIDAELARFATESVLAIRQVHIELTDAKREINLLKRELQHSTTARAALVENAKSQETALAALQDAVDRLAASSGSSQSSHQPQSRE